MTAFLVDSVEVAGAKVVGTPMLANALNVKTKAFIASLPAAVYADAGKMLAAQVPAGYKFIGAIINGAGNAAATNGVNGASTVNVSIGDSETAEKYVAEKALKDSGFYPVINGAYDDTVANDIYVYLDAAITVSAEANGVKVILLFTSIS